MKIRGYSGPILVVEKPNDYIFHHAFVLPICFGNWDDFVIIPLDRCSPWVKSLKNIFIVRLYFDDFFLTTQSITLLNKAMQRVSSAIGSNLQIGACEHRNLGFHAIEEYINEVDVRF